ncbi:unnamed protein product, partial [marine sediment metagenome]
RPHPGHGNPVRLWNIHVSGRGILPILRYEISVFAERYSDWAEDIPWGIEEFYQGAFAVGFSIIDIFIAALIIYAALKMKDLKHWGLAVAASILAMIPCISPCCIIGLPIGIWCLVVLMKPAVKEAFD